jgi:methionine-rich copper-binding protein CopC
MKWAPGNRGGVSSGKRSREYLLRKACIESLEQRLLLSGAASGVATFAPTFINLGKVAMDGAQTDTLTAPFSPAQIEKAYGTNLITFGSTPGNGAGQTIGIVDAYNDPDIVADAQAFSANFGLPAFVTSGSGPTLSVLNQNGTTTLPGNASPGSWDVEESLDVEWAHSIAPQANIVLFEANSNSFSDLLTAAATAADYTGVSEVSMSWGGSEFSGENLSDSTFTTPANHGGVTFIASAGDDGASPQYPSVSPNVISVGGTSLTINNDGSYGGETTWSDGGGGLSAYEPQPAYQVGKVNGVTTSARATPDVSWLADPNTGVYVLDSYYTGGGFYLQVGGTSLAAPMWAALISIANQDRALSGLGSLDGVSQVLPTLYKLSGKDFNDITTGNNGYPAGPGYDLATGLGTPIPTQFASDLAFLGDQYLQVIGSTPAGGSSVISPTAPTTFTIDLLDPVNPSTVLPGDLTVNGIAANSVSIDPTQKILTFGFTTSPVTTQGTQTMAIAANVMKRASDGAMNLPFNASFLYVTQQLQVVSTTPAAGSVVNSPLTTLDLFFNEPVNPASVSASNLTLSQGSVTGTSLLAGNTEVAYTLSQPTVDALLSVQMAAGAVTDMYGVGQAAYSANYDIDLPSVPFPTPLSQVLPAGSQIYTGTYAQALPTAGDVDHFTINLDAGQTLTAWADPNPSLQMTIVVTDPNGKVLGAATAANPAVGALLESLPVAIAGTYTIAVSGATTGSYTLGVMLNAAQEFSRHGGPTNNTIPTAQNLDGGNLTLPGVGNASIESVVGTLASSPEYYAFNLTSGELATIALTALDGNNIPALALYNSGGTLLATGTTGATNVSGEVANFIAPASGTYYAQVSGTSLDYSLVVAENAAFDLPPNGTLASAQSLGTATTVAGAISSDVGNGNGINMLVVQDQFPWGMNPDPTVGAELGYNVTEISSAALASTNLSAYKILVLPGEQSTTTYSNIVADMPQIAAYVHAGGVYIVTEAAYDATPYSYDLLPDDSQNVFTLQYGTDVNVLDPTSGLINGPGGTITNTSLDGGDYSDHGYTTSPLPPGGDAILSTSVPTQIVAYEYPDGSGHVITDTIPVEYYNGVGNFGDFQLNLFNFGASFAVPAQNYYSFTAQAGEQIQLQTYTPGGGPGQFVNNLVPSLALYNAGGTQLATNANGAPDGRNALITYTVPTTGTYYAAVSSSSGIGEYVLNVVQPLSISIPTDVKLNAGTVDGTVNISTAPSSNLTVTLTSGDPTRLTVPATATILAGQKSAVLPMTLIDSNLLLGEEAVTITASAPNNGAATASINIHDDQTATLSVTLPTSVVKGSGAVTGTITSSAAPATNITVFLTSSNPAEGSVPATVTLLAGKTTANFSFTPNQDTVIDGTQYVTVTAAVDQWTSGSAKIAIQDDNGTIAVSLPPSGWEGQTLTAAGTVTLGGTLGVNETVNLVSSNPAKLSVPASVIVLAGQTTATFTLTLLNDGLHDGDVSAAVTASATGLASGSGSILVRDANLDYLAFSTISTPQTAAVPFSVSLDAYNIANEVIQTYSGTVALTAAGTNGPVAFTPDSATFSAGVWTGNVTVSTLDPGVTLTANAGAGITTSSNKFAVQPGPVASFQWGNISSPESVGTPFSATLTAKDANGFTANFNGTVNLSGLVGTQSTATLQGNVTPVNAADYGAFTLGYEFTPSTDLTVTAVRSYFGSSVSIWTSTGTLLASQPVSAPGGAWTETALGTPLSLIAGTTYMVAAYSNENEYYWNDALPANPPFATFGQTYELSGNGFPTTPDEAGWLVDLQVNVGSLTTDPITPTTATFASGVWTGNVTVTQAAMGLHLHADDGAGHTSDSNSFNVSPLAPAAPVLLASSDTGISNSDDLTDLNNSTAANVLQFSVANTVAGATVTLYANGKAIGNAVATGATTIVATDGVTGLPDATYSITAKQAFLPDPASAASSALSVTIDTVTPVASIAPVVPNPGTPAVASMTITFSKPVYGLSLSGLSLTQNDGLNLLTGSQTLTTTNNITWTLGNLTGLTTSPGLYTLSLAAGAAQSPAGDLSTSATQSWQNAALPAVASFIINGGAVQRSMDTLATVVFNQPVLLSSAITLTQRATGGGSPTPMTFTLASPDGGTTWNLTFPTDAHGTLPDGIYDLVVNAAGVTSAGTKFAMASNQTFTFHRLFGDFDGNGTVNNADYFQFKKAFGQTIGNPGYNALFDYDGNGVINNADYFQFKLRFGVTYVY